MPQVVLACPDKEHLQDDDTPCLNIRVQGTVQGVGFRPFVYSLATKLGLAGRVSNTVDGVFIQVCGTAKALDRFIECLRKEAPPLSSISSIEVKEVRGLGFQHFLIDKTTNAGALRTQVCPDAAICPECIRDILDPDNKRFGYPFTNCTNCGPRYSIIEAMPYDRGNTTMKAFKMCDDCQREYLDPSNRRFHAQPNCCAKCGPHLTFIDDQGNSHFPPLARAVEHIKRGQVIAIKGIGGFHLCCDAYSDQAVALLRKVKARPFKPLAIMVASLEVAHRLGVISDGAKRLLTSPQAPIVLLPKVEPSPLSKLIAPDIGEIGVMLPYSPLHKLLFQQPGCPEALVMTSGNPKGEPICIKNHQALKRLKEMASGFILHNRDIVTPVDDSVIRPAGPVDIIIRRSRGFAPSPILLPFSMPATLATGAQLKNTFCLVKGDKAYLSQHIGNLESKEVLDLFHACVEHLESLMDICPEQVVCDLHPDYLATRYAKGLKLPLIHAQHHHAHAASVMAEHGLLKDVLAICLDGTGLGDDGTIWGGEVLVCGTWGFKRLGHLRYFALPGGDAAVRWPWRTGLSMALAVDAYEPSEWHAFKGIEKEQEVFVAEMIKRGINVPMTSSCGRLFDAVGSLCGLGCENSYEAQMAMKLESLCQEALGGKPITSTDHFKSLVNSEAIIQTGPKGLAQLDWTYLVREICQERATCQLDPREAAVTLHAFIVAGFGRLTLHLSRKLGIKDVVLSGGVLQNKLILQGLFQFLTESGLRCHVNQRVPVNDGGLCLGQAFIAGCNTGDV